MIPHTRLIRAALTIIAIGAMSVPAMAFQYNQYNGRPQVGEYYTESGKMCSIGETYNGGSIGSINRQDKDVEEHVFEPDNCNNVNWLLNR